MPYQVLARKYRPERFADVVGQDHVTRTLLNALAQGRIAHGYIFSGHRGIGKTTIARILASALNCRNVIGSPLRPTPEPCNACESCLEIRQGNAVDVIEIDAATNRGIDEIRELRDAARYRPSRDKYKIYILDEAHQITDAAFNALLKTLEEPPEHIVFMMATTQPEDIPQTIRSRCQHYSFHAVKLDDILAQLRSIAAAENVVADEASLALLAEAGDGSMRDALSIMDQAIASAPLAPAADGSSGGEETHRPVLDAEQIRTLMGTVSNVVFEQILDAVYRNHSADVLAVLNRLLDAGNGPQPLARQFVRYLRNCTVAKITGFTPASFDAPAKSEAEVPALARDLLQISDAERERAARSANLFTEEDLARFLGVMLRTFDELGYRQEPRLHLELGLLKLVHLQRLLPIEELLSQLGPAPATPAAKPSPGPVPPAANPASASVGLPSATRSAAAKLADATQPAQVSAAPRKTPPSAASTVIPAAVTPVQRPAPNPSVKAGEASPATTPVTQAAPTPALKREPMLAPTAVTPAPEAPVTKPDLRSTQEAPADAVASAVPTEFLDDSAAPIAAASTTGPTQDLASLQEALIAAAGKNQTAADALHDADLMMVNGTLQVKTRLSPAMLPLVFTKEIDRLLRAALSAAPQAPAGLELVPGSAAEPVTKRPTRAPAAGSAAELAAKHPIVQQARELFSAEISNVIDLRDS